MRVMLFVVAVATLGLSGFAAWFFFGGPEEDPTRVKLQAYMAEIETLKPKARSGDIRTQYELARLYHHGEPGAQDLTLALSWYTKAAQKGHIGAQYAIGTMFANGEGTKQSYYRASEWYRLAANLGRHPDAQFALGELYYRGHGPARDYAEAVDWYRKAAEAGQPVAQHMLGVMIQEGSAGKADAVEAYKWFTLALAHRRRIIAHDPKLDTLAARDSLIQGMNQNQIKRGEEAVRAWRPKR